MARTQTPQHRQRTHVSSSCTAFLFRLSRLAATQSSPHCTSCRTLYHKVRFAAPAICRPIHSMINDTIFRCCSAVSGTLFGTFHHLFRHPRQQVAVACCATNTGCRPIGVCLPSFSGTADARRKRTKSSAWRRIVFIPFSATYRLSAAVRRNRRRNADRASFANASSCVIATHLAEVPAFLGHKEHDCG